VIVGFRCKHTAALFRGERSARFRSIERVAQRKLTFLHQAADLFRDLGAVPGHRLEALKGNRAGQWSIRINDQWRLCFRWRQGEATDVEIVDYH
jgi:proteic killer suppression protein